MSHQWIPSNGTEGHQFINDWCSKCARDAVSNGQKTFDDCDDSELCQILDASFRGDAKEWIEHDDGRTECTAFVPLGAAQPQRAVSDPKHTFSVEDDGSVRIEIPSGVGVDVDARGTATSRIIAAALRQLIAENAAILAANRDCLTHFEDMLQEYTGMAHFVADLRAVFSLNECGFTELMNAAIQAQEDAVRYRWMLDHASAEEWREWGKMDAYDDVERAIDEAMRQAAELGNGVGIMK